MANDASDHSASLNRTAAPDQTAALDHAAASRVVYDHSADQFVQAVGTSVSEDFEAPFDQDVLAEFADTLAAKAPGAIIDVGCGPGRIARYLDERGLDCSGIDIAPKMIDAARFAHPHLTFEVAPLTNIPTDDGSLLGAVYWYSIITTPPADLATVWAELDRVLQPDGLVLIAFQAGDDDAVERPNAYGSDTHLTLYRHSVSAVIASLKDAGFERCEVHQRDQLLAHEDTPQAFVVAQRPA